MLHRLNLVIDVEQQIQSIDKVSVRVEVHVKLIYNLVIYEVENLHIGCRRDESFRVI